MEVYVGKPGRIKGGAEVLAESGLVQGAALVINNEESDLVPWEPPGEFAPQALPRRVADSCGLRANISFEPAALARSSIGNHGVISNRSRDLARLFKIRIVKVLHGLIGVDLHT